MDNQQAQINTLSSIITEYNQYKDINKELELTNNELNIKITDVLQCNVKLEDKIINRENMKEFYKNEVKILKAEIKDLNANIKEVDKIKEELINQFKVDLENKLEVEKSKHQLELDKAINKEQLLQEKYIALKEKLENIKPINKN